MLLRAPDLKSFNGDKEKHKEALTIYNECQSFRDAVQTDTPKQSKEVYELAAKIENLTRGWGVHAAGVIISPIAIPEVVPTFRRQTDDAIVTQYDAHGCEDLGLVKMDFLGLKNLNTTKQALENIKLTTGKEIVLEEIPLDDKKTFELIGSAQTLGVFQLDGGGIRSLLKRMRPDRFEDISATIALYRPGPMGQKFT